MKSKIQEPEQPPLPRLQRAKLLRIVRWAMLLASAIFYALHFVHLAADFPGNTAWVDWSRYTDEGWYSDAAVRHFLLGHWYLPGDFNPAVALPVWPLLEAIVFRFSGVSLIAARALAVVVFGIMLWAVYRLITRCERLSGTAPGDSLAAPLAMLFFCTSPFFFAFEREAILEPLLAALAALALLLASRLEPLQLPLDSIGGVLRSLWPAVALGVLLPLMVLTKPTAITLLPAIGYVVWFRAGNRVWPALRLALPPALLGVGLWLSYYLLLVRPHYVEDYRYLFSANDYTGFQMEPLAGVGFHTLADGRWMGSVLYPLFFIATAFLLFFRPRFFRNPLVPALLLWVAGYFVFLGYHNNLQSRYYLVLAVPVTMLVAMALEELRRFSAWRGQRRTGSLPGAAVQLGVAVLVLAVVVPDGWQQLGFILHPDYTYVSAAQALARTIRADPTHPPLILSVSGSDLSLMTGLPSINTEFGTLDLDQRVRQYRPGWYVAWNELEDEDMKAIAPFYRPVRVAAFPAMNDPDRNVMILYRLDAVPANPLQR